MNAQRTGGIGLVGFDADDTLWRSQDYFDAAQADFERIVATYVDLDDVSHRLYAVEKRNLALFGYGVKGMVLSMVKPRSKSPKSASAPATCTASSDSARTCCGTRSKCWTAFARRSRRSPPTIPSC